MLVTRAFSHETRRRIHASLTYDRSPRRTSLLGACFHATIETGLTPSTKVLERKWASSWIYGLVPPKTVETASRCPDGVAKVETQLSFLNQVVHILTLGIYTPMDIRVTCALPAGRVLLKAQC